MGHNLWFLRGHSFCPTWCPFGSQRSTFSMQCASLPVGSWPWRRIHQNEDCFVNWGLVCLFSCQVTSFTPAKVPWPCKFMWFEGDQCKSGIAVHSLTKALEEENTRRNAFACQCPGLWQEHFWPQSGTISCRARLEYLAIRLPQVVSVWGAVFRVTLANRHILINCLARRNVVCQSRREKQLTEYFSCFIFLSHRSYLLELTKFPSDFLCFSFCPQGMLELDICGMPKLLAPCVLWFGVLQMFSLHNCRYLIAL